MTELQLVPETAKEENAVAVKSALQQFVEVVSDAKKKISEMEITDPNDKETMKLAKNTRLFIKNKRLEAKRIVEEKRGELKEKMATFKEEDDLWREAYKILESTLKDLEEDAKYKEEYAVRLELEARRKTKEERWEQLKDYTEEEPYGLDMMPESQFQDILSGAKKRYEEEQERIRKEEEERIEQERIEQLSRERSNKAARLSQFIDDFDSVPWGELEEETFATLMDKAQQSKEEYDKKQEEIRLENERLQKEVEEREAKEKAREELQSKRLAELLHYNKYGEETDMSTLWTLSEEDYSKILSEKKALYEKEQQEAEDRLKKQSMVIALGASLSGNKFWMYETRTKKNHEFPEEMVSDKKTYESLLSSITEIKDDNERYQKEQDDLKAQMEAKQKEEAERKEREAKAREAEEKAKKEALLAPDREKLLTAIDNTRMEVLKLSQSSSKAVHDDISEKLEGWRKWAKQQIETKIK